MAAAGLLSGGADKPESCGLEAYLRCAPDFDHDGLPDWLARLRWVIPTESLGATCDLSEGTESMGARELLFLVSAPEEGDWKPLGGMRSAVREGAFDFERTVDGFFRIDAEHVGLFGRTRQFEPGFGCDRTTEWLGLLEHGSLRVMQETPPEACPEDEPAER